MKKITLLLILNLSFLIFNSQKVKAQWVTIPDANFVTWLTTNYPSCMNGNQMDTTCSGIINATYVNVQSSYISNITGIEYFNNLTNLVCSNGYLTFLPQLPSNLEFLLCYNNQLLNLPLLPNTLKELRCSSNQLSGLPSLPNSLLKLECRSNLLTNLPSLPSSLQNLDFEHNQVLNLQSLPANLQSLLCGSNLLTMLPTLPNSLLGLSYGNNLVTVFPTLPNNLRSLMCDNLNLTNLPQLPDSLRTLVCNNNQLLNLPLLPDKLQFLNCNYNQLTQLPILPSSMKDLSCNGNYLSTLPILPNSLYSLGCNSNLLTGMGNLPNSLNNLSCDTNQLTNLPTMPNYISRLSCQFNQLVSIPQVPNVMYIFKINNNNISCLSNLPQVSISFGQFANISNNPLTCVPNQTNYSLGLPLCIDNDPINNPNNCQSVANIVGNVYQDLNNNCTYNSTDLNTQNIPVKLYDNQNNLLAMSYTINGVYSFAALQPDTFNVKINDVVLPLDMACGQANNQSVILNTTNQTIANINFPVVCDSTFDVKVHSATPQGWVFPGQVHILKTNLANDEIWYNLNCVSTVISCIVTITVSGPVDYVAPAANALIPIVSGNNFTYTIADFNSLTPSSFGLQLLTDTTAQLGNQICVHVTISPNTPDADTTNNEYDFCYNVLNSYDPNMKEVYPVNVLPSYNDWFTYTIHFQNTGSAPAFNIRLRDTLDTQLDINTFEFLGASHTANTSLNGRNLSVRFNNIMLPDSTSNYDGSMGYYQYRIKPLQNLPNGSNIKNTAYIYFDYNPAIITNTTENQFDIFTNAQTTLPQASRLWLFPNPSAGIFTFNDTKNLKTVEVCDIFGQLILSQGSKKQIDLIGFAKGIYFAKINGEKVLKLVKE